jgi:hypothetical protein
MMIDLSDLSHSYPFLHLSRKFNISYEQVMKLAELYDADMLAPPHEALPVFFAIYSVCKAPWRWQFPPEGRGL